MKKINSVVQLIVFTLCIVLHVHCIAQRNNTTDRPVQDKSWTIPISKDVMLEMAWIAPGKFFMGSALSEPGRNTDEGPQIEVTITRGYWLGKTEITIGQWKGVTGLSLRDQVIKMLDDDKLYDFNGTKQTLRDFMHFDRNDPDKIIANDGEQVAMYYVSWHDAIEFCQKLTVKEKNSGRLPEGYVYTLPTEAQWEFACRAGTTTATFASPLGQAGETEALSNIAWYNGNSGLDYQGKKLLNSFAGPRSAGQKLPNAWGLQDMPGNLWEWCLDWVAPYPGGNLTDPEGPANGAQRVNRGGSWGSGPYDERSANRAGNPPAERSAYRGFRIALRYVGK